MNPDNNYPQSSQTPSSGSFSPGSVYGPPASAQNPAPNPPEPHNYNNPSSNKTKKIIAALGVLVAIFVIIAVAAIVASGGKEKQQPPVEQNTGVQELYTEPTAIQIENLNNSVSDDITNLSTDTDFPSDKLSDDNLDL